MALLDINNALPKTTEKKVTPKQAATMSIDPDRVDLDPTPQVGVGLYKPGIGTTYMKPAPIKTPANAVQTTDPNRDAVGGLEDKEKDANQISLDDERAKLGATLADITSLAGNIGSYNQGELDQIEQAGASAGAQYDNLIENAKYEKRQGEGKAIVGAGRRGGFMRARDAGEAALAPTEGGTWFGNGGRLEDLKSAYDRNINQLEVSKMNAIEAAKSAQRIAIRTGKQQDVDMALKLYDAAVAANNKAQELYNEKLARITQQKQYEDMAPFNKAESVSNIVSKLPVGQSITIDGMTFTGIKADDAFFKGSDIIDLMKQLPVGQEQKLTDPVTGKTYTIQGIATSDPKLKQFETVDDQGNYKIINFDPTTNSIIGVAELKGAGKTKSETRVSVNTSNYGTSIIPVYDGQKQIGYIRPGSKGDMLNFDMSGNQITNFPTGSSFGTLGAGNPKSTSGGIKITNPITGVTTEIK